MVNKMKWKKKTKNKNKKILAFSSLIMRIRSSLSTANEHRQGDHHQERSY